MCPSSRIEGFYKLSPAERTRIVKDFAGLSDEEARALSGEAGLAVSQADKMVENALGTFAMPLGIATNFRINGKDHLIPMAIEEPSVV
ncbi:MAG: hydroxymethylglutaryl-CoA reductase, partial [Candidatus Thermoplasmatota archaeon]|nr:hydroxymethylglutaryl-CoA reductase [Candidatus Thermoplasmatota archaeon]